MSNAPDEFTEALRPDVVVEVVEGGRSLSASEAMSLPERPVAPEQQVQGASHAPWPEPMLQPRDSKDCEFYASAYIARCLGFTAVEPDDVRRWCQYAGKVRPWFVRQALAVPVEPNHGPQGTTDPRFWLGPGTADWVTEQMDGRIALACVWRVQTYAHAVVVLGARPDGVLLMDPWSGFVVEPWEWFLGTGPGRGNSTTCHFIEWFADLDWRTRVAA